MASLDPDYLQMVSKTIVDIYSDATSHMIRIVASRLARGLTVDDGWATRKLLEVVELRNQAVRALDGLDSEATDAVTDVIKQAATRGSKLAATELAVTGTPAASTSTGSVDALAHETVTRLSGTHAQILRATVDAYRAVVAEVSAPGVVTGTVTRRQAAARAIDRWAAQGVTGFVDRAGRRWEIETYAEMTTRTAAGRAFMQGSIDQYQTEGHQFVIVSDAPEECAQCRPFEGKGLSLDGTGVGTRVGGIRIVATLRDAQSKGLFHQNCRHRVSPIIPGATKPMTHTADPEGDQQRQRQRTLERRIRSAKRRLTAAEQIADPEGVTVARARVRQAQADMRDFIDTTGRKRLRTREQIGTAR